MAMFNKLLTTISKLLLQIVLKYSNMKILLWVSILSSQWVHGQINVPKLSPEAVIRQTAGYTQFEIRYGRPAARDRKIMGELVPFNKLWRTGAGNCTTIAFDRAVVLNQKTIPPGVYAFVTIPGKDEWTVFLNSDTSRLYGDPSEYNPATEAVRLTVGSERTNRFYESLTIDLDIVRYDAELYLSWENTQIHFPIATGSHEKALNEIKAAIDQNPADPNLLAEASYYYSMNNEDSDQVLRWLDKAIAVGGDRWAHHQKVDMLEKLKKYREARTAAATAIDFLQSTKPVEWEFEVEHLKNKMKAWPSE